MMRKMILLMALVLALALTGCGGSNGEEQAASGSSQESEGTAEEGGAAEEGSDPFADAPKVKFQFAENFPSSSYIGVLGEEFAKKVAERTNGTVEVEFYADGLLGDEATVVGMVEANTVGFARVNLASLQATVPDVGVLTLPYLYKDAVHCNNVLESEVGQEILNKTRDYGIVGYKYLPAVSDDDFRSFYATEPINSLADLAGKKIRVQESEIVMSMVEHLGAVPTPMAFGEVFQALQTGVVDVAENPLMGYYLVGHYEAAKYFIESKHQISPNMYIMSEDTYNAMNEVQLAAFEACLDEYIADMAAEATKLNEDYKAAVLESGCEIIAVDTTEFREAVLPMFDNYPEYKEYLDRILAVE